MLSNAAAADWLIGGDARARLGLAAAIAQTHAAAAFARLAGCRRPGDALLLIGQAVGAIVPGSAVSVGDHLRRNAPMLIVLDDADHPSAETTLAQLEALAPEVRWLRLAPVMPDPAPEHAFVLPERAAPPELSPQLGQDALSLALLPAGLPLPIHLPHGARHPTRPGRVALERSLIEGLLVEQRVEHSRIAEDLVAVFEDVLSLAEGAPLPAAVCVEDLLAVRWMGEVLADPDAAARATATAGRLLTIWGQPGAARGLLGQGLRRETRAAPDARALLRWAESDAMLSSGAAAVSQDRFETAAKLLEESQEPQLLATMIRRRADVLAARGLVEDAERAYRRAQAMYRILDDPAGMAASLRGIADLAISRGELIAAAALYEQVEPHTMPDAELLNRRLGQATLAISQGDLAQAATLLDDATASVPVLSANIARRRADLALRNKAFDAARAWAVQAIDGYARAGERAAFGQATRLLGDIAATCGALGEAAEHYQRAIATQIEIGDLHALRRTLNHAIALEDSAGDRAFAQRLRSFRDALTV